MAQLSKPLPALYTVYVLRSTIRHASLYIGSTPNPPRRLKQHNGVSKGGAARTSRDNLRPWEMVALVSGFPSMVAALKFEWALTNPHMSLHIPSDSRLAISTKRKKNGMPRRPAHSLKSVMSNIHLLTGVPSFARWPLNLHLFAREAQTTWDNWINTAEKPVRADLRTLTDFSPSECEEEPSSPKATWGIHALDLDYKPLKEYVQKAHDKTTFEQEGKCVHCKKELESGKGLYPMCSNGSCEAMGHLDCWSSHALVGSDEGVVIPALCTCPSCGGEVRWGDMMKELSLRVRGSGEVEKLLKKKTRTRKAP